MFEIVSNCKKYSCKFTVMNLTRRKTDRDISLGGFSRSPIEILTSAGAPGEPGGLNGVSRRHLQEFSYKFK